MSELAGICCNTQEPGTAKKEKEEISRGVGGGGGGRGHAPLEKLSKSRLKSVQFKTFWRQI